ncbi:hypothetical protein HXZ96_16215, partial [Myroides sp. 1372]|nr:hypothetical protein [Myroides sp. 1372]
TQLVSNEEFITNIIEELKDTYGNVGYDTTTNQFFYYDADGNPVTIDITDLLANAGESLTTDGVIGVEVDGIVGTEAQNAVLQALKLSLNNDTVTSIHIKDGTIQPIDLAEAGSNQVLVTGADKKPVWKDQSKVAPQFFYMPAVIFDTSATGIAIRDLYQEYVNQFTGGSSTSATAVTYPISHGPAGTIPTQYGGGIIGSAGAPDDITVLQKGDLYYYVTYYDEAVFENLSISADGKLTYTVKAAASSSSYMNIVFVIK